MRRCLFETMRIPSLSVLAWVLPAITASACSHPVPFGSDPNRNAPRPAMSGLLPELDPDEAACKLHARAIQEQPPLAGTPDYDRQRAEVLGRARGEPMVFVREPARTALEELPREAQAAFAAYEKGRPGARVAQAARSLQHHPAALRALLLREGYAYAPDPHDALSLIRDVRLADLFDEPEVWLHRRTAIVRLVRVMAGKAVLYRYADGPSEGREAQMIFGDRLAIERAALNNPLHRDLRGLALDAGFDRAAVVHRTERALLADLRFGGRYLRAVIASDGASLRLECIVGSREERLEAEQWVTARTPRLQAIRAMQQTVDRQVEDAFRFDRPRDEEGPDKDGFLRPLWLDAYKRGQTSFGYEGVSYAVLDRRGKAWPPEVCVDFVLDTYERTAGTWFTSPPEVPTRVVGRLDFDSQGMKNRRGVLAFGAFASEHPELFEFRRFEGRERIPFAQRTEFFRFLVDHADEFAEGDVLAIQGLKRDGRIHQHAILLEALDPITGFPYGLADQMKVPRRRTWEGIMAEAPKRSLLFRARPGPSIFDRMNPGE